MSPLLLSLALFAAAPQAEPSDHRLNEFPEAFRGTWAEELKTCGTEYRHNHVKITADGAAFYEIFGELISAVWLSENVLRTDFVMFEHVETWTDTHTWRLVNGGRALTWEKSGVTPVVLWRCPSDRSQSLY